MPIPFCAEPTLPGSLDLDVARDFGSALLIGALIGIEREKRNAREGFGIAGLRSFVMLAQIGAIGGYLAHVLALPWLFAAVVVASAGVVVAGYLAAARSKPDQLGLTTELAAIVTVLLGGLTTTGHREIAVGLGVATAALLAYKKPLHDLVGRLGWDDLLVGVRFLSAAFLVLPLLPDEAIDPWGAIRPYKLWLLVLLISGLSLIGYVATRWLGPGRGIAITAATGGLVSSTAVTLTFAKQSREENAPTRALAGGVLLAWAVMFARVLVAAALVAPALLEPLAVPFTAMAVACAMSSAALLLRRRGGEAPHAGAVPLKNPFSLLAASKFALLFAAVQLLLVAGREVLPQNGVYAVAALAGLTDVDAITLSMAERANGTAAEVPVAVTAIAIASLANTLVKAAVAAASGKGLGKPVLAATALVVAVGAAAVAMAAG